MRIVWTEPGLYDLAAARAWIAMRNKQAADRQRSRPPPQPPDLRESEQPGDRVNGDIIEVLRVLHSRRRWPDIV